MFFTLLNESYKINANERLEEINIELVPHIKKQDAREVIEGYKKQIIDLDSLKPNTDYTQIKKLKEIL